MGLSAPTWFPRDTHFLETSQDMLLDPCHVVRKLKPHRELRIGALVCSPSLQVQAADIMSWKEVIAATFGPND